jgi:Xaa-Pro aminopeptidase
VSHASRRAALRGLLRTADVEALLVTDLVNVRYLTGFTGYHASLLPHVDGAAASRFCTDGRYDTQSARRSPTWSGSATAAVPSCSRARRTIWG